MRIDVFTLVPHAYAWLTEQLPVAAVLGGELELRLFNYRDTTPLRSGQVDDEPYGGGAGMVLRVDVVAAALEAVYGEGPPASVVALTPQGRPLTQAVVEELAGREELTLLSSRFEGFDERIVEHLCSDAISIGPYVLSNGDLAAMVRLDAVGRTLPCGHPVPDCEGRYSDRVLANRLIYHFRDPRRGEIIVFHTPPLAAKRCGSGGVFVKRLIGLPGDRVSERNGYVYINGKRLDE